jgi:hypothetical protein
VNTIAVIRHAVFRERGARRIDMAIAVKHTGSPDPVEFVCVRSEACLDDVCGNDVINIEEE